MSVYTTGPIEVPATEGEPDFYRADLEFHGVDHSGPSYEARVYVNNPDADESTPRDAEHGYVGSFFVFGHGGCFGDEGHCDIPSGPVSPFDRRQPHALTPVNKKVIATDAIRAALGDSAERSVRVSVVPVVKESPAVHRRHDHGKGDGEGEGHEHHEHDHDHGDVLKFEHVALITYD